MKYVYHYHARQRDYDKQVEIDGILTCDSPIDSMDRYHTIKSVILKDQYMSSYNGLAITSLTLLHTLDE